jgi:hypothetical protein
MVKRAKIGKTPREHFKQAVDDELTKFVRKELDFQKADRLERAARFRLPLATTTSLLSSKAPTIPLNGAKEAP